MVKKSFERENREEEKKVYVNSKARNSVLEYLSYINAENVNEKSDNFDEYIE